MSIKKRTFSKEFKLRVVKEARAGKSQAEIARQYQILPKIISRWVCENETYAGEAFAGSGNTYTTEARMRAVERENMRLRSENEILKKALSCLDSVPSLESGSGGGE